MSLLRDALIRDVKDCLAQCFERIEHCTDQLTIDQVWRRPGKELNSIGNLILHLTGNIRQWLIAGLGELPDVRDRPAEFREDGPLPTELILQQLKTTLDEAYATLDRLDEDALLKVRQIQGFEVDGMQTIFDSVPHFKGHTQEIICLTRMMLGDRYQFHWQPTTPEQGAE